MKIEELLKPCPECGSKDKTQHRDFDNEFKAYGSNGELKLKIIIDEEKCTKCGLCVKTCPVEALKLE